jgi:hypothetical protein
VSWRAGRASFLVRSVSRPAGRVTCLDCQASWLDAKASFLVGHASFLTGQALLLAGPASLAKGRATRLVVPAPSMAAGVVRTHENATPARVRRSRHRAGAAFVRWPEAFAASRSCLAGAIGTSGLFTDHALDGVR